MIANVIMNEVLGGYTDQTLELVKFSLWYASFKFTAVV